MARTFNGSAWGDENRRRAEGEAFNSRLTSLREAAEDPDHAAHDYAVKVLARFHEIGRTPGTPQRMALRQAEQDVSQAERGQSRTPDGPTDQQVAYYRRLADHPSLTFHERNVALNFLEHGLTRAQISREIDALKKRIERGRGW